MSKPAKAVLTKDWDTEPDHGDVSVELRRAADAMTDFFRNPAPEHEVVRSPSGYTLVKPLK
jgi:hypothetical protein